MIYTAPEQIIISSNPKVFLAGTIDQGASVDWQTYAAGYLNNYYDIYNPRRVEWDSSWKQTIHEPKFKEQVTWELDAIELADVVLFNFTENSLSPITLMELGICKDKKRVVVSCADKFWRRGNIEVFCDRQSFTLVNNLNEALERVVQYVQN